MKKFTFPLLIVVIVLQLIAPFYMNAENYYILHTGDEYKFEVSLYDPYDAYRGRYLMIQATEINTGHYIYDSYDNYGNYGIIEVDDDGFAYINTITEKKPDTNSFIIGTKDYGFSIPVERYYTDENIASELQDYLRSNPKLNPYVILRVKDGKAVVQGLYIDGVTIEEYYYAHPTSY